MPLSHVLTNLDDARDTLVNSINSRGGNLEESATLYQCAAAVNTLASGVLSINGHLPDESGSVTIPDATQSASGLMSAADKAAVDGMQERGFYPQLAAVPSPVDFDQMTETGFFFIEKGSELTNYPGDNPQTYGTLQVLSAGDNLTQMFLVCGSAGTSVWERNRYRLDNGSLLFTGWRKLMLATAITEKFGSSGYFKLPYGTIVQYGLVTTSSNSVNTTVTLPVSYQKQISTIVASCGLSHVVAVARDGSLSTIRLTTETPLDGAIINWMTVGY